MLKHVNHVTATARRGLVLLVAVCGALACSAEALAAPTYDQETIDAAAVRYRSEWQAGLGVPTGWNGSTEACLLGAASAEYQDAVLRAINYVRSLMGIGPLTLNRSASAKAQAVAVTMAANGKISHSLQNTNPADLATYAPWCFTSEVKKGAAQSLLYLDTTPGQTFTQQMGAANAVGAYMDDWGAGNAAVGHRAWLATQNLLGVGVGATPSSNAIAFNQANADGGQALYQWTADWQETMWPSPGLFPCELLPTSGRWSYHVSDGGTYYGARSVTVTRNGVTIIDHAPASYQTEGGQFIEGQTLNMYPSRIVWQMPALGCPTTASQVDTYRVTVHGGPRGDVVYEVSVFAANPASPSAATSGESWAFGPEPEVADDVTGPADDQLAATPQATAPADEAADGEPAEAAEEADEAALDEAEEEAAGQPEETPADAPAPAETPAESTAPEAPVTLPEPDPAPAEPDPDPAATAAPVPPPADVTATAEAADPAA